MPLRVCPLGRPSDPPTDSTFGPQTLLLSTRRVRPSQLFRDLTSALPGRPRARLPTSALSHPTLLLSAHRFALFQILRDLHPPSPDAFPGLPNRHAPSARALPLRSLASTLRRFLEASRPPSPNYPRASVQHAPTLGRLTSEVGESTRRLRLPPRHFAPPLPRRWRCKLGHLCPCLAPLPRRILP